MDNNFWLEAREITAIRSDYEVVKNLNLKLKIKEDIILLGPNGSGKSSLVDLINRNIYPIEKKNSFFKLFNKELIDLWELRKRISTVNNEIKFRVQPNLKVIEVIISGLYGKYCKIKSPSKREIYSAYELISLMSLKELSEKSFHLLSDGEKQITLIARALINKPEILILDEPNSNLDLKSKFFLIDKIQELSEMGINIFCITHDIDMITENYNRVLLLKNREIIADGIPSEIINTDNINKLFDIKVKMIKNQNNWSIYR